MNINNDASFAQLLEINQVYHLKFLNITLA
jgi:hypothetical protein